jgi:hypothetical protein
MATQIKVWEIKQGKLVAVPDAALGDSHREAEIEGWICETPELLGEDLLVISRQLDIPSVGRLDLLCMDATGKLVIVELKRDLSPREAVAQALDYASWLDSASEDDVSAYASAYLKRDLSEAFEDHFQTKPPDWVCQNHRIILVAARLDSSAERIVNYLAERYGVEINAVFVTYSKLTDGKELVIRSVLVPEDIAGVRRTGKRPTEGALMAMASDRGTAPIVEVCRQVRSIWGEEPQNTSGGSFRYWGVRPDGGGKMVFGINVSGRLANPPVGELDVWIRTDGLAEVTGVPEVSITQRLSKISSPFSAGAMSFVIRIKSKEEAEQLVDELKSLAAAPPK